VDRPPDRATALPYRDFAGRKRQQIVAAQAVFAGI
jgi:hypothetical protein